MTSPSEVRPSPRKAATQTTAITLRPQARSSSLGWRARTRGEPFGHRFTSSTLIGRSGQYGTIGTVSKPADARLVPRARPRRQARVATAYELKQPRQSSGRLALPDLRRGRCLAARAAQGRGRGEGRRRRLYRSASQAGRGHHAARADESAAGGARHRSAKLFLVGSWPARTSLRSGGGASRAARALPRDRGASRWPHAAATLRMGLLMEDAFVRFWQDVAEQPPAVSPLSASSPRPSARSRGRGGARRRPSGRGRSAPHDPPRRRGRAARGGEAQPRARGDRRLPARRRAAASARRRGDRGSATRRGRRGTAAPHAQPAVRKASPPVAPSAAASRRRSVSESPSRVDGYSRARRSNASPRKRSSGRAGSRDLGRPSRLGRAQHAPRGAGDLERASRQRGRCVSSSAASWLGSSSPRPPNRAMPRCSPTQTSTIGPDRRLSPELVEDLRELQLVVEVGLEPEDVLAVVPGERAVALLEVAQDRSSSSDAACRRGTRRARGGARRRASGRGPRGGRRHATMRPPSPVCASVAPVESPFVTCRVTAA